MQHLVYKIKNITTLEYYIGVHSTLNINDGYMGSGTLIKRAIKKHGLGNFSKEILHTFETRKEALEKESELVNFETLQDINCYNLIIGGGNGVVSTNEKRALFVREEPEKHHEELYYNFELIYDVHIKAENPLLNAFYKHLSFKAILQIVSHQYNYKNTHNKAKEFIYNILATKQGFYNNIICKETTWQKINHQKQQMA